MKTFKLKPLFVALSILSSSIFANDVIGAKSSQSSGHPESFTVKGRADTTVGIYDIKAVQLKDGSTEINVQFNGFAPDAKTKFNPETKTISVDFGKVDLNLNAPRENPPTDQVKGLVFSKTPEGNLILNVSIENYGDYSGRTEGSNFYLKVNPSNDTHINAMSSPVIAPISQTSGYTRLDFKRTKIGEDQAVFTLPSEKSVVNITQEKNKVVLRFKNSQIPNYLLKSRNFNDIRAIINHSKVYNSNGDGVVELSSDSSYEYMAYQTGKKLTVSFSKKQTVINNASLNGGAYSGRRITMQFQDADVRKMLQLLSQYMKVNIVLSDSIRGNVSLNLIEVPYDQALSIILKTQGLAQRKDGSVIWIAPVQEMAKLDENEAKANAQLVTLAPLVTTFIQLNYANGSDVLKLIKPSDSQSNTGGQNQQNSSNSNSISSELQQKISMTNLNINGEGSNSLLSPRGKITVDARTNTLIISDTSTKIDEIKRVVSQIDIPVKQVMVEARIVHASTDFSKGIGVRWGFMKRDGVSAASNLTNLTKLYNDTYNNNDIAGSGSSNTNTIDNNVNLDLGGTVDSIGTSSIAIGLINTTNQLLGLELSALQSDGLGEVLSSPKVMTGDKQTAKIRSGMRIPYQTSSANNGTNTSFQDAVLELNVTPSITPDGNVQMNLSIHKDTLGRLTSAGYAIDTNQLDTNVLVGDGETVVLGGLYETSKSNSVDKVPVIGSIPVLGNLFKNKGRSERKQELLIFITPMIVDGNMTKQ